MRESTDLAAAQLSDPKIEELVRRLVDAVHPRRIYLFGSRARGDARPDSDYDILLLVEQGPEQRYSLERDARYALWDLGTPVDLVVLNWEFFERRRQALASLPATVEREGKLLFVRQHLPPEVTAP